MPDPDPVWRIHKDAMTAEEINLLSRMMNPLITAQKITVIDLGEWQKKSIASKAKGATAYSPEFESFWQGCPNKTGKGSAAVAFAKALGRGHTALTITNGLPVYISYERGRQKADGDKYKPLHPATWLNGDRFLDEAGTDLSKPRVSEIDKVCSEVGRKLGALVQGVDRISLQECLDAGMTGPEILVKLEDYKPRNKLTHFFYSVVLEIEKGTK